MFVEHLCIVSSCVILMVPIQSYTMVRCCCVPGCHEHTPARIPNTTHTKYLYQCCEWFWEGYLQQRLGITGQTCRCCGYRFIRCVQYGSRWCAVCRWGVHRGGCWCWLGCVVGLGWWHIVGVGLLHHGRPTSCSCTCCRVWCTFMIGTRDGTHTIYNDVLGVR